MLAQTSQGTALGRTRGIEGAMAGCGVGGPVAMDARERGATSQALPPGACWVGGGLRALLGGSRASLPRLATLHHSQRPRKRERGSLAIEGYMLAPSVIRCPIHNPCTPKVSATETEKRGYIDAHNQGYMWHSWATM